ncbi:MAG: hypothetical protein JOZ77_05005 [Candidatus Eremiobacteraeota bacterium]|nr:hypothetical protein [Candidatus Eremiobacteraeota bacterium]
MTRGALVVSAALIPLLLGNSAGDLRASLRTTAAAYLANIARIAPVTGRDSAFDYYERLIEDGQRLDDPAVTPGGGAAAQRSETAENLAALDLMVATQLVARSYQPMASVRGLGDVLIRSSRDGTMQPVAVYVPVHYDPRHPASLIVFLHGDPQTESDLLAPSYVADLAESSNTIVAAPYGRGYSSFRGTVSDVYDALQAATDAFRIDPHKRFLAGYSMGGYAVFHVAPVHPQAWSAVMCIAGSLRGSDASDLIVQMRRTPFYVLTGSNDETIPTRYPTATAAFLTREGFEVSFYSQRGGTHVLASLLPILTQAWDDMLHEIVRAPPPA